MNKIVLAVIVLASISAVGVLSSNLITLNLQAVKVFDSIADFDNPICTCLGNDGQYSMTNCQGFAGPYTDTNMLCVWEAGIEQYGNPPSSDQGCGVGFWKNNADISNSDSATDPNELIDLESLSVWPPGYQPDYLYNEMFHTTFVSGSAIISENHEEESDDTKISKNDVISDDRDDDDDRDERDDDDDRDEEKSKDNKISKNDVIFEPGDIDQAEEKSKDKNEDENVNDESKHDDKKKELTLLDALKTKGGKMNNLLRHSVAALLNAAHSDVNYPYSVVDVISMTQVALISEDYKETAKIFEKLNDNSEKPPLCLG